MSVAILALMPGKISNVMVKVGDAVAVDDELVILEAMKMENPIYATTDGAVKEVKVKVGDMVEADQTLVVIG